MAELLDQAGVATRFDAPTPATRLRVRPAALEAALDNLLANAAQHATPGTPVTLTLTLTGPRRARHLRIAVHNHGTPISAAVQARVWDRFFTTRAADGGSGLGLAIVRAVATAHAGAVGVDSTARGGTTFWLELPAA